MASQASDPQARYINGSVIADKLDGSGQVSILFIFPRMHAGTHFGRIINHHETFNSHIRAILEWIQAFEANVPVSCITGWLQMKYVCLLEPLSATGH